MDDFFGTELIPLNEFKHKHPDIYINAFKKYIGRESLTEYRLPIINCRGWGKGKGLQAVIIRSDNSRAWSFVEYWN